MLNLSLVILSCYLVLHFCSSYNESTRTLIENKWSGNITSNPGKYLKNLECEWLIKAPSGGKYIELTFLAFETECLYDYVAVYDSDVEDTRLQLAAMSGNLRTVEGIVSASGQMYIHLASDADKVFRGFKAIFSVTVCPNNCTGNNGRCNMKTKTCTCNTGWYGEKCGEEALRCGYHGELDTQLNKCRCDTGYFGWQCDMRIPSDKSYDSPPYNRWYSLVGSQSRQSIVSWDQAKKMLPRHGHTAHVIADYLYVFGGYDLNIIMYSFKKLHILSGNWSDVPINPECPAQIPRGRYMHSSAGFKDSIIICGGFLENNRKVGSDCWLFNTTDNCWYSYPTLPVAVTGHTLTLVGPNQLYLFGGLNGGDTDDYSCSLYTIRLQTNRVSLRKAWTLVEPAVSKCSEIRRYAHSAVFDEDTNSLVVFGGFVPIPHIMYRRSSDVLLYSIENRVWSTLKLKAQVPGVVFHSAVKLGRFMVVYGGNANGDNINEAECFNPTTHIFDLGCMDWVAPLASDASSALATVRYTHAAARYHNTMVVVGGFNGQPMNDVVVYYPPREDCTSIGNKDRKGAGESSGLDVCNALQHCVRCGKKCKPVKKCRAKMMRCSVCYRLAYCTQCTMAGCEWCVQESTCRSRDSGDNCGVQSPEPWWGTQGTLLTTPIQCQTKDMPPGLHWVKYVGPVNLDHPDHVSLVKLADVSLLYTKQVALEYTKEPQQYYGHLRGFLNNSHRDNTFQYKLRVLYKDGIVSLYIGRSPDDLEHAFTNKSTRIQSDRRYPLPRYKLVFLEAVLSQYIIPQQRVSNMTIKWDGGGAEFDSEETLHEDVLVPYRNGSCTHFGTCLSCLTDQLCGWNSTSTRCQQRSPDSTPVPRDSRQTGPGYLITDFGMCTKCDEHITCFICAADSKCEWRKFKCHRRVRYDVITSRYNMCPATCSSQTSCVTCTELHDCVWCKSLRRCISLNVHVALYPYGGCSVWYNGFVTPGSVSHCNTCEVYRTCRECLSVRGCGWCGLQSASHTGSCIQGNFELGYCESPLQQLPAPLDWYYTTCPAVNECALGLHHCPEHAECMDTAQGFRCECKPGFQHYDGICVSKCDTSKTCIHGECSKYNLCECNLGYTGPNCDQDCLCNGHSTCSQGQGICDDCQHMTEGYHCELCTTGAYRTGPGTRGVCNPCKCNHHHDPYRGYCDKDTGRCYCTGHTAGLNCELCGEGYYGSAVDGGMCYMVARSRVQLDSVEDGALGNVETVRRYRHSPTGYESVMWYITPPLDSVSVVLTLDGFTSTSSQLPGVLYMWEGLPAHISGSHHSNLTSRLLALISAEITSPSDDVITEIAGRDKVTVLYEGMLSTTFNISYQLRNCTHNCSDRNSRFNATCTYGMQCVCVAGYMGPHCSTPICPDNCNEKGECVPSTGVCKCDSSSSGLSCSERSTAQITWSVQSFDWVPWGYDIMRPRMGHSTVVIQSGNSSKLVTFGGYDLYNIYSDIWTFDTSSLTWEQLSTGEVSRGEVSRGEVSRDEVSRVEGSRDEVSRGPTPRYLHSVVQQSGVMCVVGGITKAGFSDEVWCTNLVDSEITWTNLQSIGLPPIAGSSVVGYTGEIWYLFGGVTETGPSNSLYKFSVNKRQWDLVNTTGYIEAMYGHSMALYRSELHVIASTGYYKYNILSHTWLSTSSHLPIRILSSFHSLVEAEGVVYVVGGKSEGVHRINQELYALQLDSGSYIQLTTDSTASMLSANLLFSNNKLYIVGGFNGTVHSLVLSYDLHDSICYLIKEKGECTEFGCAWCDNALYSPKPCIPTPILGCRYNTVNIILPCRQYADCYTCAARSCYWTTSHTCSEDRLLGSSTCSSEVCAQTDSCALCHEESECVWYKGRCTALSNVGSGVMRSCPVQCGGIGDCTRCTVTGGCSWSTALETCLSDHLLDWFCLFSRCDMLVHPVQCPEPCTVHRSCSVCREHSGCGWCQTGDDGGGCRRGDVSGAHHSTCTNWHYFTCPLENECAMDVHTCRSDQLCVDLDDGYNCTCSNGTVNSEEQEACIPSCADIGCVHGKCVAVGMCECAYGYYGADCSLQCDCTGHSACIPDGLCQKCEDNTTGTGCKLCVEGYIRKGKDCISCWELCNKNSDTCIDKEDANKGYLTFERAKCVNCANNTAGPHCRSCKSPDYFYDYHTQQCMKCMCNLHAWTCDQLTGLDCRCQNHTESSYHHHADKCLETLTCYKHQCDICQANYSGDPRNGSLCYPDIAPNQVYNFSGEVKFARPFHVKPIGTSDHWIYLEMVNMSGRVFATMDPRRYTISNNEQKTKGFEHIVYSPDNVRYQYNTKRSTDYNYEHDSSAAPRPMLPWISGVDEIDAEYNDLRIDMNCERRFIKYSPVKYGPNHGIYFIVQTLSSGGELNILWYASKTEYNYYLTAHLLSSGLILMLVFYYFTTNAINSLIYLWQQRAERRSSINNKPKCLVSIAIDVGDDKHTYNHKTKGYNKLSQHDPLPPIVPVATQEFYMSDTRCGLSTVLIRLPGGGGHHPELVLGTAAFKTRDKSLDFRLRKPDEVICETSI